MDELMLLELENKIKFGCDITLKLDAIKHVDGIMKLQKKIRQEIAFLNRLMKTKSVKKEHLCCSNLRHLGAIVKNVIKPNVCAVCKSFHIGDNSKLVVDIVADKGSTWIKVIARNPKSLSAHSSGNSSYGARTILDHANDYLQCAKRHPCMYKPPNVIFKFDSGIEENLASKLRLRGINVEGEILPNTNESSDDEGDSSSEHDNDIENIKSIRNNNTNDHVTMNNINTNYQDHIDTLNLDVTTLMAYVSNMTNGFCDFIFKHDVLTQQCNWESERPVKPILDKLFQGMKLVCCQTAWDNFFDIVTLLGGPKEKARTEELKSMLTIMPDNSEGEDDLQHKSLRVRGNVRNRSKMVFNFGHRIKSITVSANEGFLRAAYQQGVSYAAFIHESRALTEGKEKDATPIERS